MTKQWLETSKIYVQTEKVGGTLLETLSCKDTAENDMMMMMAG